MQPNDTTGAETLTLIDKLEGSGRIDRKSATTLRKAVADLSSTIETARCRVLPVTKELERLIAAQHTGEPVAANPLAIGHFANSLGEMQAATKALAFLNGLLVGIIAAEPSPQDSATKTLAHLIAGDIQPDIARALRDAAGAFIKPKRAAG